MKNQSCNSISSEVKDTSIFKFNEKDETITRLVNDIIFFRQQANVIDPVAYDVN